MTRNIRRFGLVVAGTLLVGLMVPPDAAAQRRGARRGAVRAAVVVGAPVYYPYYSPYVYDPFWDWRGIGYWQYPPPYYYRGVYDRTGAARLRVTPKQTEVFIDGYYVGTVDEFDGMWQRLRVEAGEHELQLYLDGYRTETERVLFRRDGTLTLSHVMQPLAPGESSARPEPRAPATTPDQVPGARPRADAYPARPGDRTRPPRAPGDRDAFGTLVIRVQPADAEILVDGERWDSADPGSRLSLQLAEGPHRVDIRKEGYRSYTANVRIRRGQSETLNVSLTQ